MKLNRPKKSLVRLMFVERGIMANPMINLEFHYPMINFLMICIDTFLHLTHCDTFFMAIET